MAKITEKILVFIVSLALYLVKTIDWISKAIAQIVEFLVVISIFVGIAFLLKDLGSFWLKLFIFGSALWFLSFIALVLWRPKKINSLMKKILK